MYLLDGVYGIEQIGFICSLRASTEFYTRDRATLGQHPRATGRSFAQSKVTDLETGNGCESPRGFLRLGGRRNTQEDQGGAGSNEEGDDVRLHGE